MDELGDEPSSPVDAGGSASINNGAGAQDPEIYTNMLSLQGLIRASLSGSVSLYLCAHR